MIEFQIDQRALNEALVQLGGMQHRLNAAVEMAVHSVAPKVRTEVIGTLERDVTTGKNFIRRAVKAVRMTGSEARFKVFSKRLFLDDYELSPREQTARPGVAPRDRPGFNYKLRRDGDTYSSRSMPNGKDGSGSKPFLARTEKGTLRVMYRRSADRKAAAGDDVYLAYAPSIQYHAVAPEVEDAARETSMRLFHEALDNAVRALLRNGA